MTVAPDSVVRISIRWGDMIGDVRPSTIAYSGMPAAIAADAAAAALAAMCAPATPKRMRLLPNGVWSVKVG